MENTERFEQLLRTQSYQELSLADREWVAQFVSSEEAYEAMRRATQQMEEHVAPEKLLPDPAILKSLMKSFTPRFSAAVRYASHAARPDSFSAAWTMTVVPISADTIRDFAGKMESNIRSAAYQPVWSQSCTLRRRRRHGN